MPEPVSDISVSYTHLDVYKRQGKWNGGFAPYGYKLEKGMLYINEEEAEAIRIIFDQYVHTDIGANGPVSYTHLDVYKRQE